MFFFCCCFFTHLEHCHLFDRSSTFILGSIPKCYTSHTQTDILLFPKATDVPTAQSDLQSLETLKKRLRCSSSCESRYPPRLLTSGSPIPSCPLTSHSQTPELLDLQCVITTIRSNYSLTLSNTAWDNDYEYLCMGGVYVQSRLYLLTPNAFAWSFFFFCLLETALAKTLL